MSLHGWAERACGLLVPMPRMGWWPCCCYGECFSYTECITSPWPTQMQLTIPSGFVDSQCAKCDELASDWVLDSYLTAWAWRYFEEDYCWVSTPGWSGWYDLTLHCTIMCAAHIGKGIDRCKMRATITLSCDDPGFPWSSQYWQYFGNDFDKYKTTWELPYELHQDPGWMYSDLCQRNTYPAAVTVAKL